MKAIETLRAQLAAMGATLDASGGYALHCDAPRGYVWRANFTTTITIPYATNSQQWLVKAIREEMPAIKMGLRLADDAERVEIDHGNGDDEPTWIAAPGAPDVIEWGGMKTLAQAA